MNLTRAEIEAERTPKGGFTRETLAKWGVPWPPPKGWLKTLASDAQNQKGGDGNNPGTQ